jgi:hypothetical protein
VRRLQQAIADREVREAMDVEDDVMEHFRTEERIRQNIIAEQEAALAENKDALARERAEKEYLLAELAALKA